MMMRMNARESLYLQLERILHEGEEVVYEFSSGNAAVRWLEKHPGEIDLLFLDVEMADMNGMETPIIFENLIGNS